MAYCQYSSRSMQEINSYKTFLGLFDSKITRKMKIHDKEQKSRNTQNDKA